MWAGRLVRLAGNWRHCERRQRAEALTKHRTSRDSNTHGMGEKRRPRIAGGNGQGASEAAEEQS